VFVCITVGNLLSFNYTFVFITFFIGIFATVSLSFVNKSIIGGFVLGLIQALSFWVDFLTSVLITGIYDSSLIVLEVYRIYALIEIFAFAVTGLFFGLLGYIANQMFFEDKSVETYIFRDYWSNVYNLGKNNKREYNDLDRRLNNIHLSIKD